MLKYKNKTLIIAAIALVAWLQLQAANTEGGIMGYQVEYIDPSPEQTMAQLIKSKGQGGGVKLLSLVSLTGGSQLVRTKRSNDCCKKISEIVRWRNLGKLLLVGEQSDAKISFWYGARTPRDLLYRDEFDALESTYPRFSWSYAFSEVIERRAADAETGFIHDIIKKRFLNDHPNRGQCCFYICGPPPMLKAVLAMLSELGVPKESVTFDDFGT